MSIQRNSSDSNQAATAGVLVATHSFLLLAVAISLGPLQVEPIPRQQAFGGIMVCAGIALASVQLVGGGGVRRLYERDVLGWLQQHTRMLEVVLPSILLLLWLAVGIWVFRK